MSVATALELRRRIAEGELTAASACAAALDRISDSDPALNAFLTVSSDRAMTHAHALDSGEASAHLPLLGVPVAVKDNICTRGVRTTAGSKTLAAYVPPYDATVVARLEAAGALIVAKTNCDEFAMGSSTEYSAFGPARNPWDTDRIAGGSSGGSAVAVATRAVPLALGSETGGSVRQPAALCGVFGLKPTYGRISRYGLLAFASSVDQVGIFAGCTADIAACLRVVAGKDPRDATTRAVPVDDYVAATGRDARALRVGVPNALLASGLEPGVRRAFDEAIERFRELGATIHDVSLPHGAYATATYAILVMAEASSNLSRYDGVRYGGRADASTLDEMYEKTRSLFGREVKRRIMLGTFVLSAGYYEAYYAKAQKVRRLIRGDYDRALAGVDVIATPTSPTTAFRLGERLDDPVRMYLADVFTVSANLAGLPALSIPCGFAEGLPVGLQLTARSWGESTLLQASATYERTTSWWATRPPG